VSQIRGQLIRRKRFDIHLHEARKRAAEISVLSAAPVYNYPHRTNYPAVLSDDINCLLHPASAGNDIFGYDEFLAFGNRKTATKNQAAGFLLNEDMPLA